MTAAPAGTLPLLVKALRTTVVLLAAGAALSLAVAVALAAPAALSPARSAAAGEYCAPGAKQQRQQASNALGRKVRAAAAAAKRFRANQLRARRAYRAQLGRDKRLNVNQRGALFRSFVWKQNRQYQAKVRALNTLKRKQKAAVAALGRCD